MSDITELKDRFSSLTDYHLDLVLKRTIEDAKIHDLPDENLGEEF